MSKAKELYGSPWTVPEYIIVLHHYFKHKGEPRHHLRDYVQELSRLMGRTPASINMRLENFQSLDESVVGKKRKGLGHIKGRGREIFDEWSKKQDSLRDCAQLLLNELATSTRTSLFEPDAVRIPKAFGQYELMDPIGDGSFGSVYSCAHLRTGLPYAIKIVRTDRISDVEVLSRFRREIKALKAFTHPNVIKLHEDNLEEERDFPAFIMDLARCSLGEHVEETFSEKPTGTDRPLLPFDEAKDIFLTIARAVEAMHQNDPPLIHRDLNPNNILRMPDGKWVVADFSLVKFRRGAVMTTTFATQSRRGGHGTQGYTAPEQWQDFSKADERADVYSLGVLIWELFSPAWPPMERGSLMLPEKLDVVVLTATDRHKDVRYSSVAKLLTAFEKATPEVSAG